MFHLETFKKCLSLIKHSVLHVCADSKHPFNKLHKNLFFFLALLRHRCVLCFVQVLLSPLLRLLLPLQYNKDECSFVCGADHVSSRNNVLAPQDNSQTSLSTVFNAS